MKIKNFIIGFGILLSISLLAILLVRLDWSAFLVALKAIYLPQVLLAAGIIMIVIVLRALRWTLIAGKLPMEFKPFWQAANVGYLGNLIYPARAGEVLRVLAAQHLVPLPLGHAITSSVLDRMVDIIMVGSFTLLVLWLHGNRIDANLGRGVVGVLILAITTLTFFVVTVNYWYRRVQQWHVQEKRRWLQEWLLHALDGIRALRQTSHLFIILAITLTIFLLDYFWMWQVTLAFGWHLPFEAGLTVGVFLLLAVSLPSAPGFIGIYQVACVIALNLYGIDETSAVAYSLVLQFLSFSIMGIQGLLVITYCGFNLSAARSEELTLHNNVGKEG